MFDEPVTPVDTLLAHAERIDSMAKSLIAEVGKFRERLLSTSSAVLPIAGTPQEKKSHPIKICLTYFDIQHRNKFKDPDTGAPIAATIHGAKDAPIMKRLIDTHGEDRVRGFIDQFFQIDDDWTRKTGYTVGVFSARVPGLISSAAPMVCSTGGVTAKTQHNGRYANQAAGMIEKAFGTR
jgi:hypothetical protein